MERSEKAAAMIVWFEGRTLPAVPFQLNAFTTVTDAAKMVNQCVSTMKAMEDKMNRGIGVELYRNCYMHLYELKKYIEENAPN